MAVPSIAHVIYISFAIALGFYAGWSLGSRSVRNEWARAEKRRREKEESSE